MIPGMFPPEADDVGFDIYMPMYKWDDDVEQFVKNREVVLTRDRTEPQMIIADLGGDIGEVYFKVGDLLKTVRILIGN